jgi:hypothetical protein
MIKIRLFGGNGGATRYGANVESDGSVVSSASPHPPLTPQKIEPFKQFLTDDGTATGSDDMGVDGSSTNVDFYIKASDTNDRYIKGLSILVGYASAGKPYLWGDGAALTNGMRLFYTNKSGDHDIDTAIKTNTELLRIGNNSVVPANWEIRHVGALNDYGYLIKIDLVEFSHSQGIKLDSGTTQRLVMCVRDDATAATTFNVQAIGFDRFE